MKQIDKLKQLSKSVLNDKDYNLILKFIRDHDFDSISDIIKSETIKEYRLCDLNVTEDQLKQLSKNIDDIIK